jgi:periplasmic protein TonB
MTRHLHGTVIVKFTIDRTGELISSEIISQSGVAVLDQESLTLIARAQPLPSAPADLVGREFTFTVPVQFNPPR